MSDLMQEATPEEARRSRLLWTLVIGLPVLAIVIGAASMGLSCFRVKAQAGDVETVIAEAQKAGLAVTAGEFDDRSESRPNLDQALQNLQTATAKSGFSGMTLFDSMGVLGGPDSRKKAERIESAVIAFEKYLRDDPPGLGADWTVRPKRLDEAIPLFEYSSRVFALRAYDAFQKGDWNSGQAAISQIVETARRASQWPCAEGTQTAVDCLREAYAVVMTAASDSRNDSARLGMLKTLLKSMPEVPEPTASIRGIICINATIIRNYDMMKASFLGNYYGTPHPGEMPSLNSEDLASIDRGPVPASSRNSALLSLYLRRILPYWQKFQSDPASWPTLPADWQKELSRMRVSNNPFESTAGSSFNPFAVISICQESQTKRACCIAMIDALMFRARSGSWSASIADLSKSYKDAMHGKPLNIVKVGGFFRVYSFGPNGVDDGGLTAIEASRARKSSDDVIVRFPYSGYP